MAVAIGLHALFAVIWVGGMFFAYAALRPAAGELEPPARAALWSRALGRFFPWVWASVVLLLATGYWMIFAFGGMAGVGMHVHLMQGIGILMMLLFLHVYFAPYRRLKLAVAEAAWERAGEKLAQIRRVMGINTLLGVLVVLIGASGRYW